MFNFRRRASMTGIFMELSLPTFNTVVHNSRVLFIDWVHKQHCAVVCNVKRVISVCQLCFSSGYFIASIAYIRCRCVSLFFLMLYGLCLK